MLSSTPGDVTDGARMVFGEGDSLPGLIVDAYADTVVMQCQSAGAERIKPLVVDFFMKRGAARVVERGDADVRQKEGLPSIKGLRTLSLSPTMTFQIRKMTAGWVASVKKT